MDVVPAERNNQHERPLAMPTTGTRSRVMVMPLSQNAVLRRGPVMVDSMLPDIPWAPRAVALNGYAVDAPLWRNTRKGLVWPTGIASRAKAPDV